MKQTKRLFALCAPVLAAVLLLCACGTAAPAETAAPEPTAAPVESAVPTASLPDANLEPDSDPEAEADTEKTPFETAQGFVDRPLSELTEAIGEPLSTDYVTSCLIPGGQDGELHYDGFTVYTVTDGETETILDVKAG